MYHIWWVKLIKMKIVFYSLILNHHQAAVADVFFNVLGDDYSFVETAACNDKKGGTEDFSTRPYLLKAWESVDMWNKAMYLAKTADVCVFGGYESLPFEKARLQRRLLSFDMSERLLKRGLLNLASPRILKMILAYHFRGWNKQPLYKLCMSAFAKKDQYRLFSFKDKCYKWGYFTQVDENFNVEAAKLDVSASEIVPLMWCGRFLMWKHPELPVLMAKKLKKKGYRFQLNIYGDEGNAAKHDRVYQTRRLEALIENLGIGDCVHLMGGRPNSVILQAMQKSAIYIFTSDCHEGWGVVANEALSNGCALVASDTIGSAPYLVENGYNGFLFESCNVDSLTEKVEWLLTHPQELKRMQHNAYRTMYEQWNPKKAVSAFLKLIDDIQNNRKCTHISGPCSEA